MNSLKLSDFPDETLESVARTADIIKERGIYNPFILASLLGYDCSFIDIIKPFALTTTSNNSKNIYISNSVSGYSKKILCFHELGHILCEANHDACLFDPEIDQESEFTANLFTSHFLPIFSRIRNTITPETTLEYLNKYVAAQII